MSLPEDRNPRPTMGLTRPSTLVVTGLLAAALMWLAIDRYYGDFPTLPLLPAITLLALGVLEIIAAVNTKTRIDRRSGTEPVDPLLVARYVVLAKASSLAGSLFTGAYAGLVLWLFTEQGRNTHAQDDFPVAGFSLVGAVMLTVGGLLLERACRVPPPPPSSDPSKPGWADGADVDTEDADN